MLGHLHPYFNQTQLHRQKVVLKTRQTTHSSFQKVPENEIARWRHVRSRTNCRNTMVSRRTQQACSSNPCLGSWGNTADLQWSTVTCCRYCYPTHLTADTIILYGYQQHPQHTQPTSPSPVQLWGFLFVCFLSLVLVILCLKHRTALIVPSKQKPSQKL